jgi:hypothetical protein
VAHLLRNLGGTDSPVSKTATVFRGLDRRRHRISARDSERNIVMGGTGTDTIEVDDVDVTVGP